MRSLLPNPCPAHPPLIPGSQGCHFPRLVAHPASPAAKQAPRAKTARHPATSARHLIIGKRAAVAKMWDLSVSPRHLAGIAGHTGQASPRTFQPSQGARQSFCRTRLALTGSGQASAGALRGLPRHPSVAERCRVLAEGSHIFVLAPRLNAAGCRFSPFGR